MNMKQDLNSFKFKFKFNNPNLGFIQIGNSVQINRAWINSDLKLGLDLFGLTSRIQPELIRLSPIDF